MHKLWCNELGEFGRSLEIELDTWGESNYVKLCQLRFLSGDEGVKGAEQDDYYGDGDGDGDDDDDDNDDDDDDDDDDDPDD